MPATLRYPPRGGDQPGLLLSPDHLRLRVNGRWRRVAWWELLGIAWLGHQRAELHLASDERLELPPLEDLADAVGDIERRASLLTPAERVECGRWLHPARYFGPDNRQMAAGSLALGLCAAVGMGLYFWLQLRDEAPWLPWVVAVGCLLAGAGLRWHQLSAVNAGGVRLGLRRIPWHTITGVGMSDDLLVGCRLPLLTVNGRRDFYSTNTADLRRIEEYLRARQVWRDAPFEPAGPMPLPERSLSLTGAAEPQGDRGLALAEDR